MGNIKEIDNNVSPYDEYDEYEDDDADDYDTDEVIESCLTNSQSSVRQSQAVERIEQANLYLTILNHQLFSPGSARPEIISQVEIEIKDFIMGRLEVLLGMRQPAPVAPKQVQSDFSVEQIAALQAIANRLVNKPSRGAPAPQIIPVRAATQATSPTPVTPTTKTTPAIAVDQNAPPVRRKKKKPKTIVIRPPTEEEGNRGSDGTSYAQAVGQVKPVAMPSQLQLNAMNIAAVEQSQQSMASGQSGEVGALLTQAILLAQKNNANIQEED